MLKEIIAYKDNLPLNCMIINVEEYPIHFHNDLEVVFVLEGRVHMKNGYYNYEMQEGDIYILNDRELHSYYSIGEPNTVMLLQLNLSYFSRYYEALKNSFFVTDINESHDKDIEELQEILAHIALECEDGKKLYEERAIGLAHDLIDCLFNNFQYFAMEDGRFINESRHKGNKILAGRLKRTIEYMYENYTRRLTLAEIAEREHLSIYYMSHFIKEATGLSFQELLGFIRVEESEKLLLGTGRKIGDISVESGFSAVRYYISYFTKWFGMHPAEYRQEFKNKVKGENSPAKYVIPEKADVRKLLLSFADESYGQDKKSSGDLVSLELDTKDYMWVEEHNLERFRLFMKPGFMKPVAEVLRALEMSVENIVAAGESYFVFESVKEGDHGRKTYCIMLLNLGEKRDWTGLNDFPGKREYFIRLTGLDGEYTVARWKLSKTALSARVKNGKAQSSRSSNEMLLESWLAKPEINIESKKAMKVLSTKAMHEGSTVELVLVVPVNQQTSTFL